MIKFHFLVFFLTKVYFPWIFVFFVVCVLFRTCLLSLSNVSLLGILELRKDIGATILQYEVFCLQMSRSLSMFHTSLHRVLLLQQSLSFFHHPFHCLNRFIFLMSLRQCNRETLQSHLHQSFEISNMSTLIGKRFLPLTSSSRFLLSSGRVVTSTISTSL